MENNRNIDRLIAEKLRQSNSPSPSPQLQGQIMVKVVRKARRRAVARSVRNVALGVLAGVLLLVLMGVGVVLLVDLFGLLPILEQMDSYLDSVMLTLRSLAESSTFMLLSFVSVAIGVVMIVTQLQSDRTEAKRR